MASEVAMGATDPKAELKDNTTIIVLGASGDLAKKKVRLLVYAMGLRRH